MYGELIPEGGGDVIPLSKPELTVGRRESCDIVLRFANVSGKHCQLTLENGYWFVQDLNSQNGVKVDGVRTSHKVLQPGCILSVAKHHYKVYYSPQELGASGPPPVVENELNNIMSKSLMERAGLVRRKPGANDDRG